MKVLVNLDVKHLLVRQLTDKTRQLGQLRNRSSPIASFAADDLVLLVLFANDKGFENTLRADARRKRCDRLVVYPSPRVCRRYLEIHPLDQLIVGSKLLRFVA